MPKIFYLGGGTHKRGMLRAVLTMEEFQVLSVLKPSTYCGSKFPDISDSESVVLAEITAAEASEYWKKGFFEMEGAPGDVEESLRGAMIDKVEYKAAPPRDQNSEPESGVNVIGWLRRAMRLPESKAVS